MLTPTESSATSRPRTAADPFKLPSSAQLGRLFSRRADPDREELPHVREAIDRDAAARGRLRGTFGAGQDAAEHKGNSR